jgi:hypothetical protein
MREHLSQKVLHGWAATAANARAIKVAVMAIAVAGFFTISTTTAKAITQLEFLQWMVQLTGDNGQFTASSGSADYVQWARSKGMNPGDGWNPTAVLTPEQLAQSLIQLYGLNPRKFGGDYFRILEREGITIDRTSGEVTRAALAGLVDEFGFQSRTSTIARSSTSKKDSKQKSNKPPKPPKPPKTPKVKKPKSHPNDTTDPH